MPDIYSQLHPWQQHVIDQIFARNNEPDPLDEILEAAGIPSDAPQRLLRRRDGYNIVTSARTGDADYTLIGAPQVRAKKGLFELISGWKIEPDTYETLRQHVSDTGKVTINGEEFETNQITITYGS